MSVNSSNSFDFGNFFTDFINNKANNQPFQSQHVSADETDYIEDDVDIDELKRDYDQLKEDFNSYRKRVNNTLEREKDNVRKEFLKDFISSFVLYSFEVYRSKTVSNTLTDEDLMMLKKLNSLLTSYGIEPLEDSVGKPFDHNTMEAVCVSNEGSYDCGTVLRVFSNGFKYKGEVIIPQRVEVRG